MRLLSGLGLVFLFTGLLFAQTPTSVFVELKYPAPTAVARYEAERSGQAFDAELHRASIRLAQDNFLRELTAAGILYTLTSSTLQAAGGTVQVPDRYAELINAARLEVAGEDVGRVRGNPNVKHISVDEPPLLDLNNSVPYIRANCPYPDTTCSSARSAGLRGTGQVNPDGSSTGQVIAVLDTGMDHTNPMFDSRFDDPGFGQRSGDLRPVRLQGSPFLPGTNHPKVAYRFLFAQAPVEGDDTGHGTNVASTAAGLKARADSTLNNGEVVEGVAPGGLLMDYKVCPSLACVGAQILLALDDAARERDFAGNPKPRATVVNMSFGDSGGNPNSANAVAAGNLQFLGAVPVASAGNSGPRENTIGTPSAGRLVLSIAATTDPGTGLWSTDVLDPSGVNRNATGAVVPAKGLSPAAGQRSGIRLFPMAGTPPPPPDSMAQYYVFVRSGQTIDEWPASVRGRIGLVKLTDPRVPVTTFAQIANNGAAAGAVAVLLMSNTQNPTAVSAPIPAANILIVDGEYLVDLLSSTDDDTMNPPNGALSEFPIRINPPGAVFVPDTAGFSSRGPNNDFRVVKPDITAPGVQILMGASKIGPLGSPTGFISASGTSFSGPHMAGAAALVRDAAGGRSGLTPSQVRAALMNSSTNLREQNGAPIPDDDLNNLIHETGAGLADMVRAISVRAVMGTNDQNGAGGPDDPIHPNFLPSYSFGEQRWIGTELPASDTRQRRTITATIADVSGQGGSYTLSVVDAGALRGDITRPLDTPGFSVTLSQNSGSVLPGEAATFDVIVAVDGNPSSGLQIAGTDDTGARATEFLWYVVATRTDGSETLRMPFYLRVAQGQPGGVPVGSTTGGGWLPRDGDERANFGFNAEATSPAHGHVQYDDAHQGIGMKGSVNSVSVSGNTATFSGPCTLKDGRGCSYTVDVEDNAEPGRGADRFAIRWVTSGGQMFEASGLLGGGNIQVRTE